MYLPIIATLTVRVASSMRETSAATPRGRRGVRSGQAYPARGRRGPLRADSKVSRRGWGVLGRDNRVELRVREERDLLPYVIAYGPVRAANEHVGLMPISRRRCAECWVGLVFNSPAASM